MKRFMIFLCIQHIWIHWIQKVAVKLRDILNVKNVNGESLIIMSVTARWNFEESQIKTLEKYGKIEYLKLEDIFGY
jgi:hypothetical protein